MKNHLSWIVQPQEPGRGERAGAPVGTAPHGTAQPLRHSAGLENGISLLLFIPRFPHSPPEQEAAAPPAPRGAPGQWGSGLTQEKGWGSSAVRRHWGNPPHPQPKRGNRAPRNPLMGAPWLRAVQKAWDSHAKESCL